MIVPMGWRKAWRRGPTEQEEQQQSALLALRAQIVELHAEVHREQQRTRETERAAIERFKRAREEWERERQCLTERLAAKESAFKETIKALDAEDARRQEQGASALAGTRRELEDQQLAWKAERIRMAREWAEERARLRSVPFARLSEEEWQALQTKAEKRERELRESSEASLASVRRQREALEEELQKARAEADGFQSVLAQRDQVIGAMERRNDVELEALRQRLEVERTIAKESLKQRDLSWHGHVQRLGEEIESWKRAWERREADVQEQWRALHEAQRETEARWHQRLEELTVQRHRGDREGAVARPQESRAFLARATEQLEAWHREAASLRDGGEAPGPEITKSLQVYEEIREYLGTVLAEYRTKIGVEWTERTAAETAVLKALETGRVILSGARPSTIPLPL